MDRNDKIAARLARLVDERGSNPSAAAKAAGLNHTAIRDIITRKTKHPTFDTLARIAEALDVSVAEIVDAAEARGAAITVAGRVGAGARVPLVDGFERGDGLYHVRCPDMLPAQGIVAVEVDGDSMAPMYQPGHVLFFRRATHEGILTEDIGCPCVVEDAKGDAWVKLVKRGSEPGLFNLISLNPAAESIWDQRIKWAARVRLALGADLVERV